MHNMPVNAPAELSRKAVTQMDGRDYSSFYQIQQFLRKLNMDKMPEKELNDHIKRSKFRGVFSQSGNIGDMLKDEDDEGSSSSEERGTKTRE